MDYTLLEKYLLEIYTQLLPVKNGNVADYIPELANVDVDDFAIALVTTDGNIYKVGDFSKKFTIQSISKAFVYGMALEDNGLEKVLEKVNVEPSGEAFNSISLEENTGRPKNPMINAGAIATTGLIKGYTSREKITRILDNFSLYTNHEIKINADIYLSEKETGHRNRSIAHLLRNYNILEKEPEESLDAYFRQCSIDVTCEDLALMAACLANNGLNPISKVRALEEQYVPNVLSVMASCGMYDYSGNWLYNVGMPAKSGVGGGIVAVLPGQFGLAIYSPKLDENGNSVRGIKVCEELSKRFVLHMLHATSISSSIVIRAIYTASEIRSSHEYNSQISQWLETNGKAILVFELMSELTFVAAELIVAEIAKKIDSDSKYLILDFSRVGNIEKSAILFFKDLISFYKSKNIELFYTGVDDKEYFFEKLDNVTRDNNLIKDIDSALEWCENELITNSEIHDKMDEKLSFDKQPLCNGMTEEEIEYLKGLTNIVNYKENEIVCAEGEIAKSVYFLESGKISIWLKVKQNKLRISTFSSGITFGEGAFFENKYRGADIIADTDVVVRELKTQDLLENNDPLALLIKNKLFFNLCIIYNKRLRRSNLKIKTLNYKI